MRRVSWRSSHGYPWCAFGTQSREILPGTAVAPSLTIRVARPQAHGPGSPVRSAGPTLEFPGAVRTIVRYRDRGLAQHCLPRRERIVPLRGAGSVQPEQDVVEPWQAERDAAPGGRGCGEPGAQVLEVLPRVADLGMDLLLGVPPAGCVVVGAQPAAY